jgi:hypothetical protein
MLIKTLPKLISYFKLTQNDVKMTCSASTNIIKTFAHLLKQNRVKINETSSSEASSLGVIDLANVNSWCLHLYSILLANDVTSLDEMLKYWSNALSVVTCSSSCSSQLASQPSASIFTSTESTLVLLQISAQLTVFILQNIFEFEPINNQFNSDQLNSLPLNSAGDSSMSIIEKIGNFSKKLDQTLSQFENLLEFIKKLISLFYNFIMSNQISSNNKNVLTDDESSNGSNGDTKKEIQFEYADSPKPSNSSATVAENKQPIQTFTMLIEILSTLFTRIRSHDLLNEFLVHFSASIEQLAELSAVSKSQSAVGAAESTQETTASKLNSHLNTHFFYQQSAAPVVTFQSNRKSNEQFDTFSMQIVSYIQNHFIKKYFNHQFDSALLAKLEPVFYSFLTYSTKLSLKQKTLQAWNATFGKSTVNNLNYSKRLERLFIDLREEMINNSKLAPSGHHHGSGGASGPSLKSNNIGLIAISLPCFQSIDLLLNQSTNATNLTILNESNEVYKSDEKENVNGSSKSQTGDKLDISMSSNSGREDFLSPNEVKGPNKAADYLNDACSSSSVPFAQLLLNNNNKNALPVDQQQPKQPLPLSSKLLQQTQQTVNFVFSPVGQNSFSNTLNSKQQQQGISLSASKALKTPELKAAPVRSSPRSVGQLAKRKLDLNTLIDQMPDKEFIEISGPSKTNKSCNLLSKFNSKQENNNGQRCSLPADIATKTRKSKQPLTEHQKEVRRHKSFIPMEIQSVCAELDPTVDSQMSCSMQDDDTNTQSSSFSNAYAEKGKKKN